MDGMDDLIGALITGEFPDLLCIVIGTYDVAYRGEMKPCGKRYALGTTLCPYNTAIGCPYYLKAVSKAIGK